MIEEFKIVREKGRVNMRKKIYPPLILILLLSVCSLLAQEKKVKKVFRIGVTQFTSTLASENDQRGFEKALADAGFKEKVNVIFDRQNPQGNVANARTIAQKFLSEKFDLIHTIGSPNSRAAVKLIEDIPVVFSFVTHPMEAGLVPKKSLPGTKTGTNVTGVSHRWPVSLQIEMYTQFLPKAKKWGTIYHQGDPHSLGLIKEMRQSAKRLGIEVMEAVISSSEEVMQAASFLAAKVQALRPRARTSFAVSSRASGSRAFSTTSAPASAAASAITRPKPRLPPVTNMRLPSSRKRSRTVIGTSQESGGLLRCEVTCPLAPAHESCAICIARQGHCACDIL